MDEAKYGDTVKVQCVGKSENDAVQIASSEGETLQFKVGGSQVIPGLEDTVMGMHPGQSKITRIPAFDAFGPKRDELVVEMAPERVPEEIDPQVGKRVALPFKGNRHLLGHIRDVSRTRVVVDANHPLAGQDLTVEVKLLEILPN